MAPANNQPLLSDGKKLVIAALAVFGLFLLCYGTGESTVVIAGLGAMIGVGGPILIIVTTTRAAKRTYVFGTAHVHDVSGLPTAGNTGRIQMQLIINARGLDGVPVMVRDNSVPANKWPDVGATLPVRVLETNANKVTVLWDQVRTHGEVSRGEQRFPGFSPPPPRGEPDPVPAAYQDPDDDPHAQADEDDYDDGPLPPDDRPTRTDLPPIRVDEPSGGSPVAVMDRQQVVEISPTPGSSYPGYPYEEHATYAAPDGHAGYAPPGEQAGYAPPGEQAAYAPPEEHAGYAVPGERAAYAPPDESEISPFDLTAQDLPAASGEQAPAAPRVSSRRRPSPYRRRPGNRPSTRPTASALPRTDPDVDADAAGEADPDVEADAGAGPAAARAAAAKADAARPASTADWETDWAPPTRQQPTDGATTAAPEAEPTAREAAWAELAEPEAADRLAEAEAAERLAEPEAAERLAEPEAADRLAEPEAAEPEAAERLAEAEAADRLAEPEATNQLAEPEAADSEADWPDPVARETAWPAPAETPATPPQLDTTPGPTDPAVPVDGAAAPPRHEPEQAAGAGTNGWARTVWPHPTRPETAPEEPDLPDGLDSDDEALEGGVFDPSGYAADSPDDPAAYVETVDDSYAMPSMYGIPEGGADIYVPDPFVSDTYDPEPDAPTPHEEINGHAVEIVAPPTEPYRPDDPDRPPSPIDELFAPWPEPKQRPADDESASEAAPAPWAATTGSIAPTTEEAVGAIEEADGALEEAAGTDHVDDLPAGDDDDPADVLEPEPAGGRVARFLAAGPRETILPMANPPVHGISVTLQVSDLQRSRRFYRDKLGLQELDSSLSSAVLVSGEARVLLRQVAHMAPVDRRSVHLHLEVPDVYEAYERLRADGVEFVHRPRVVPQGEQIDLCTATFRDPDGHAVEISRWELRR